MAQLGKRMRRAGCSRHREPEEASCPDVASKERAKPSLAAPAGLVHLKQMMTVEIHYDLHLFLHAYAAVH